MWYITMWKANIINMNVHWLCYNTTAWSILQSVVWNSTSHIDFCSFPQVPFDVSLPAIFSLERLFDRSKAVGWYPTYLMRKKTIDYMWQCCLEKWRWNKYPLISKTKESIKSPFPLQLQEVGKAGSENTH